MEIALDEPEAVAGPRISLGSAGPRYRTRDALRFAADHAVTQDALHRRVDAALLDQFDLFEVPTEAADRASYLLRPDLGRALTGPARETLRAQCVMRPQVQVVVSDGLSADAVTHNLAQVLPALLQALAGLRIGTSFFARNARVGLINDIGATLEADVVVLLIGERPGLGRAESLSAYLGWRPRPGCTDAQREVLSNIFARGTPPAEAAARIAAMARRMLVERRSGVGGALSPGRA